MSLPASIPQRSIDPESEVFLSSEGLSIHMRIPAERAYLNNAILTLREICEHVAITLFRANRIILAFEEALLNSIEHAYKEGSGLIELQFSVAGSELTLVVEDFGCGITPSRIKTFETDDEILCDRGRGLPILTHIPDRVVYDSPNGKGTRTSMLFYLT